MKRDYQISKDGTIFEIREDGCISKIARIDETGNIYSINGNVTKQKGGKGKYWFFIILFAIAAVILGVLYVDADQKYSRIFKSYTELMKNNSDASFQIIRLEQERDNAKSELSSFKRKVSNVYPLIITDIEIGNVYEDGRIETDYGEPIYYYNTMYLQPRIKYTGLTSRNMNLKVKWYMPDGTIRQGTSSPSDFSQSVSVNIDDGENTITLPGWGKSTKGNWGRGTYRIEIWYEDFRLKSKTFTIH